RRRSPVRWAPQRARRTVTRLRLVPLRDYRSPLTSAQYLARRPTGAMFAAGAPALEGPMEYWKRLVAHLGWADAKVQAAMESATATEPRTLELWGHILGSEHLWLARLEQRPAQVPVWPQLSLEEYGELARENQKALTEYVGRL